ncbi:hypothetical protein C8J57DRAFT_1356275 [Mycena rebaudengoi]|nr:hypothetical protein C8J57DRAFT_1356275 [Mycena rebaudengoi]
MDTPLAPGDAKLLPIVPSSCVVLVLFSFVIESLSPIPVFPAPISPWPLYIVLTPVLAALAPGT